MDSKVSNSYLLKKENKNHYIRKQYIYILKIGGEIFVNLWR